MENTQKGFLSLPVILIVLVVLGSGYLVMKSRKVESLPAGGQVESGDEENVACTMDAKMCPDGSYVGRVAPNCEFAKCPSAPSAPSEQVKEPTVNMVAGLNQKIFLGGGIYLTPLEVLSDSRCAVDVTCIWAGEIVLKLKVEKDMNSRVVEIKEGGTVDAGPGMVTLIDVVPENNTTKPFLSKDYKFTFKVDWKLD